MKLKAQLEIENKQLNYAITVLELQLSRYKRALEWYADQSKWEDVAQEILEPEDTPSYTIEVQLPSRQLLNYDVDGWKLAHYMLENKLTEWFCSSIGFSDPLMETNTQFRSLNL